MDLGTWPAGHTQQQRLPRPVIWFLHLMRIEPELLLMRDPSPWVAILTVTCPLWFALPAGLIAFGPLANDGWRLGYLLAN